MAAAFALDQAVRRADPDRWLASRLIVNQARRQAVIALYAYEYELCRAVQVTSNALLAEIRLTWWREALDEIFAGVVVRKHPAAQALADCVAGHGLERASLEAMIDARIDALDPTLVDQPESLAWARGVGGSVAVLAAQMLDPAASPMIAATAGTVWELFRQNNPEARGLRVTVDQQLKTAAAAGEAFSPEAFPAIAHVALVRPGPQSPIGKRLRLVWAMARGRL